MSIDKLVKVVVPASAVIHYKRSSL